MADISSKLSFAISYGLSDGNLHSQKLRKQLTESGFIPASLQVADIVIAHSAGCWLIPEGAAPRLVIYVGMCLNNDRPANTWRKNFSMIIKQRPWNYVFNILPKNIFYFLVGPLRNINIIRKAKYLQPIIFSNIPAIFIANRYDPWPQDSKLNEYLKRKTWTFISLPGTHYDIWDNPTRYVEIIKHHARLLD